MERTQVMLGEQDKRKLKTIAKKKNVSMAKILRDAVSEYVTNRKVTTHFNQAEKLIEMAENAVTPKHDYYPYINSSNFRKYLPELLD